MNPIGRKLKRTKDNRDLIIQNFDRVMLVMASNRWDFRPDKSMREYTPKKKNIDDKLKKIRTHIRNHKNFYRVFDYKWTLNNANYTNILECHYQYHLLEIIADINFKHPNWRKLDNIAIRILPSGSVNAECIHDGKYKYLMVSVPFLKIFKAIITTMKILTKIGDNLTISQNLWCPSNHLNGRVIETALRMDYARCEPHLLNLISDIFYYATHGEIELPGMYTPKLASLIDHTKDIDYLLLYELTEMFVICHELAHILQHDKTSTTRSFTEEQEADYFGASLYLIYSSKNMLTPYGFFKGPALFFGTMRLFVMCRNMLSVLQKEAALDAPEHIVEETILKLRTVMYEKYNKQFYAIPEVDTTYRNIISELWILTAASKIAILRLFNSQNVPSLDDLLPTIVSE